MAIRQDVLLRGCSGIGDSLGRNLEGLLWACRPKGLVCTVAPSQINFSDHIFHNEINVGLRIKASSNLYNNDDGMSMNVMQIIMITLMMIQKHHQGRDST